MPFHLFSVFARAQKYHANIFHRCFLPSIHTEAVSPSLTSRSSSLYPPLKCDYLSVTNCHISLLESWDTRSSFIYRHRGTFSYAVTMNMYSVNNIIRQIYFPWKHFAVDMFLTVILFVAKELYFFSNHYLFMLWRCRPLWVSVLSASPLHYCELSFSELILT